MAEVLRIAVWSCPRTVSTALLRSFAQRPDTTGVDEPLYAFYLKQTGRIHPMREEVLRAQAQDWRTVVKDVLLGPCPTPVQFVKHMAHHLVGDADPSFAAGMRNVFLIRSPRQMLPSFHKDLGDLHRRDIGYEWQRDLYHNLRRRGHDPLVLDSSDLLANPAGMLSLLCSRLGLAFDRRMLSWPLGRHACYGIWAPAWYKNVEASTEFLPLQEKTAPFPPDLEPMLAIAQECYLDLHARRLRA